MEQGDDIIRIVEGIVWHKEAPPFAGWYATWSVGSTLSCAEAIVWTWRWWDGLSWSHAVTITASPEEAMMQASHGSSVTVYWANVRPSFAYALQMELLTGRLPARAPANIQRDLRKLVGNK